MLSKCDDGTSAIITGNLIVLMNHVGQALFRCGQFDGGYMALNLSLQIGEMHFGSKSLLVASFHMNCATFLSAMAGAKSCSKEILLHYSLVEAIYEESGLDRNHHDWACLYFNRGVYLMKSLGEYEAALDCFFKTLKIKEHIQENKKGESRIEIMVVYVHLAYAYFYTKKWDEAQDLLRKTRKEIEVHRTGSGQSNGGKATSDLLRWVNCLDNELQSSSVVRFREAVK